MKNFFKNLALVALVLAVACPAFSAKKWVYDKKSKTVDIELWYGAAVTEAGPPPSDWKAFSIIKEKLGINLKLTALPSSETDQDTKINTAAASQELPDLFMVSSKTFQTLVDKNLLSCVDDMYAMMPNRTAKLYDKNSRVFSSGPDGKSYALAQPGSIIKNEGVIIRADWLKNVGMKTPKTTDEFFETMEAFTKKDPNKSGKADTYGLGLYLELTPANEGLGKRFDPIMGAFGVAGTWNMTKAAAGLNIHKPEYFEALQYVKKIIDAKVIDPNWLAYKKDDYRLNWKQGKFGIFREQNAALHSESNYIPFDKNFPQGELVVIDPPVGPKGKSACGTYSQAYRMYAVPKSAEKQSLKINGKTVTKKQKIAELLEWMSSDEGYYLLGWGYEGKHWIRDPQTGAPTGNGIPNPKDSWQKAAQQPYTQLRNMVYYNSDEELVSRYPTYIAKYSNKEMSSLKTLRTMQSKAWTACNGVDLLPLPNADLTRFLEQGVVEFMTGERKLTKEEWAKWLNDFDAIGGKEWEAAGIAKAKAMRLLQ